MDEKGRSRLQRIIKLVWGVFLLGFGGLLSLWSISAVSESIGYIIDQHYISFGTYSLLFCLGVIYIGAGVTLIRRRQGQILRWKMLLGLLTGLAVWFLLDILLGPFVRPEHLYHFYFSWVNYSVPVLIAGGLAGWIARRYSLVWGGMIGAVRQLFGLYALWLISQSSGMPRSPFNSITKIIEEYGMLPSILIESLIVLLIGMASGYLGQFLAHRVLRHRNSSDQEKPSESRMD